MDHETLFMICGLIAIAFVLLITVYLIVSGLPAIKEVGLFDFLFGTRWASTDKTDPSYGILPFILTSIYGTAGALSSACPFGFMTAVFLAKVAPPKVAAVIRPAVDLLAHCSASSSEGLKSAGSSFPSPHSRPVKVLMPK